MRKFVEIIRTAARDATDRAIAGWREELAAAEDGERRREAGEELDLLTALRAAF